MALRPFSSTPDVALRPPAFDIRGWEVRTQTDNEKVGKVDDLLLDSREGIRYLDVDLGLLRKHVLLPLGHAHVDGTEEVVWVEGMTKDGFEDIPEYSRDPDLINPDYERRLEDLYAGRGRELDDEEVAVARRADDAPRRRVEEERAGRGVRGAGANTLPLTRLSELDEYRVSGDADPRGWDLVTADGEKVGKISELLVDTSSMRARYLDADLDEKKLELEPLDRHVLVPLDRVQLNRDKKRVMVSALFAGDLATYPVYGGLPVTSEQAHELDRAFPESPRDELRVDRGDDQHQRFFGNRASGDPGARPREDVRDASRSGRPSARDRAAARDQDRAFAARDRESMAAADATAHDEERVVRAGEGTTIDRADDEVRIRVRGDDIIIEKRPREQR